MGWTPEAGGGAVARWSCRFLPSSAPTLPGLPVRNLPGTCARAVNRPGALESGSGRLRKSAPVWATGRLMPDSSGVSPDWAARGGLAGRFRRPPRRPRARRPAGHRRSVPGAPAHRRSWTADRGRQVRAPVRASGGAGILRWPPPRTPTLVAAAAIRPVLRRVQEVVDRRFNRSRFDAVREVDAFAAGLRGAMNAQQTASGLQAAVQRTLAPESIGIWTREATHDRA